MSPLDAIIFILGAPIVVGLVAIWYRMCWWAIRELWQSYGD